MPNNSHADNGKLDKFWKDRVNEHLEVVGLLGKDDRFFEQIIKVSEAIIDSIKKGGKILICGNGGSAADAQHMAAELVGRFFLERKAIDAEALTTNTSSLTAIGNDYRFERIFARQVEAKGKRGDILIGISTSGNSENVIEAIKTAKNVGMVTIGLTGDDRESLISQLADYCLYAPSNSIPRIQEMHMLMYHLICEFIEKELFGDLKRETKSEI